MAQPKGTPPIGLECPLLATSGSQGHVVSTSVLPPAPDVAGTPGECRLLTQSRHSSGGPAWRKRSRWRSAAGSLAAMTGLGPEVPRPSDGTGVCGVGRVRPQHAKWPLRMVFDRQIRRMTRRNLYVPCQNRGRLFAERPLCYCRRSEKRSSGKCQFMVLAEIFAPMTGRCFASRRGDMP